MGFTETQLLPGQKNEDQTNFPTIQRHSSPKLEAQEAWAGVGNFVNSSYPLAQDEPNETR